MVNVEQAVITYLDKKAKVISDVIFQDKNLQYDDLTFGFVVFF